MTDPFLCRRIRAAAFGATLIFLLLAAALFYWQIYRSDWLLRQPYNRHMALLESQIHRGSILDAHGTPIAFSEGGGPGRRVYPQGSLCAHLVGYLSPVYGRTGLEGALDPELSGMGADPSPLKTNPLLVGRHEPGANVYLTLDLPTQKAAAAALGGREGAVVAIEPSTGKILALVSNPSFDPADIDHHWKSLLADPRRPLLDRALQGRFQPGSTFKMVTASAAVDSGTDTADDEFYCPGYFKIGKYVIHEMGGEVHGHLSLAMALAQSCNVTFAQVGLRLGAQKLLDYASRFWVDRPLHFILPTATGQVAAGISQTGRATGQPGSSRSREGLLALPGVLAQTAFGQGQVAITPLEDAMIASAIANHGVLMKPYLVDRIVEPGGAIIRKPEPTVLSRPISAETAATVTSMMELTMTAGTARHLQVPGLLMAGKTGTAQNPHGRTHAWFAGFAPADHPQVVAVCIAQNGGVGGIAAGPVVRATILAALRFHQPVDTARKPAE